MRLTSVLFVAAVALVFAAMPAPAQVLPRARPAEVGLSNAGLERIAPALQAWVDSGKVAGVIAAVVRHGKLAFVASAGTLDPENARPVNEDAVFRIFSMTKPITTVAIMQMYERGKLRLDDPVSRYIPAFGRTRVYAGGGAAHPALRDPARPITIADLLTHTAGLTYGFFGNTPVDSIYRGAQLFNPNWTIAQFSDSLARLPLAFSPGTAWNYSLALDVLGRVVEVVSGMPFDRYLDSAVFRPLGMRSTAFHATAAMEGNITAYYVRAEDGKLHAVSPLLSAGYTSEGRMLSGGGGLLSTVTDYLRFAQMLLNGGELDGHRLLTRESVTLMMQNHLPTSLTPIALAPDWPPGKNGFGYGGAIRMDSAGSMPGSAGTFRWSGLGTTFFWIDPKADLIAMVWSQYIPVTDLWSLDNQFQRLVYEALLDG